MGDIETVTIVRASGVISNIRKVDYDPAVHTLYVAPQDTPEPAPMPEAAPEPQKRSWGGRRVKGARRG